MAAARPDHVVLYDEDCGFCRWSLDLILAWDRRGLLRSTSIQSPEGQALLATIRPAERLNSWHLALPSGEVVSAGAAAPPLLRVLPAGRPLAALLAAFPGATERAYRAVAAHRGSLARALRIRGGPTPRR